MSVGHKSTKEKFMKKTFLLVLVVLFTFSFIFIGCDEPKNGTPETPVTDPALHNTWVGEDDMEITFKSDATFEVKETVKGTYTAGDKKIVMTVTDVHKNLILSEIPSEFAGYFTFDEWNSKAKISKTISDGLPALMEEMEEMGEEMSQEDLAALLEEITAGLGEMFKGHAGTYSLSEDGNTLTLNGDLFGEDEEDIVLTKKK